MTFKITIEVEPDGLMCGRCRFLTTTDDCALFEPGPWKMLSAQSPRTGRPTYKRLPECIEAEKAAEETAE